MPDGVERVPLTSIRRTIARRLTDAWKVPVYQLVLSADMDAVNHFSSVVESSIPTRA